MNRHELVRDGLIAATLLWAGILAHAVTAGDATPREAAGVACLTLWGALVAYRKGHDYRQQPVGENG